MFVIVLVYTFFVCVIRTKQRIELFLCVFIFQTSFVWLWFSVTLQNGLMSDASVLSSINSVKKISQKFILIFFVFVLLRSTFTFMVFFSIFRFRFVFPLSMSSLWPFHRVQFKFKWLDGGRLSNYNLFFVFAWWTRQRNGRFGRNRAHYLGDRRSHSKTSLSIVDLHFIGELRIIFSLSEKKLIDFCVCFLLNICR